MPETIQQRTLRRDLTRNRRRRERLEQDLREARSQLDHLTLLSEGVLNVSEVARLADVRRDTVYAGRLRAKAAGMTP